MELGVGLLMVVVVMELAASLLVGGQLQLVLRNTLLSGDYKRRDSRFVLAHLALLRLLRLSILELCADDALDIVLQVGRAHRSFNLAKIPDSASFNNTVLRC